jgi:PAS domain S-box-containing protein
MKNQSIQEHIRTLNQIIAFGNTVSAIPHGEKLGEFVFEAFKSIKNIEKCRVCLKDLQKPIGNLIDEKCNTCTFQNNPYNYSCLLGNKTNIKKISVGTFQNRYGHIIFKVNSDFSEDLLSALHNFANTIGITIENYFQKSELEKQNRDLIDARKNAEESEEKYRAILENTFDGMVVFNNKHTIEYVSPAYVKQLGYSQEEEIGRNAQDIAEIIHPADREKTLKLLYDAIDNKQDSITYEFRAKHKEGHYIWRKDKAKYTYDENGNYLKSYVICSDITEQKQAEQAMKESEERLNLMINESPFPIAVADINDERVLYWSRSARKMFGHSPEIVSEWYQLAYPDEEYRKQVIERWKPFVKEALETGRTLNTGEYNIVCKDGSVKICEIHVQCIPDNLIIRFNEVTQRIEREKQNKYLSAIIENSDNICVIKDLDLKVIATNNCFARAAGKSSIDELIGKTDAEIFNVSPEEEPIKSYMEDERRVQKFKKGEKLITEEPVIYPDGTERIILTSKFPVYDDDILIATANISTDITGHKQTEQTLKKHQTILENSEEISDVGSFELDIETGTFSFSEGWLRIHGCTNKMLTMEELMSIAHPDDIPAIERAFNETINNSKPYDIEHRIIRQNDGEVRIIKAGGKIACDEHNRPLKLYGGVQDITKQKQTEQSLKESEERLQLVIKGSNDAPWDWDLIKDELYYSPQWWEQIGCEPDEIPSNSLLWEELMHPDDKDHVDKVFRGALEKGKESYAVEFRLKHKQGHYVPVLSRGFITFNEDKKPVRVSGTNLDLTERKKSEQELKKLYEDKEKFISILAHDLRSPFNGLLGFSQLLVESIEQNKIIKIGEWAQLIHKTLITTFNLLEDILQWSRAQQGNMPFEPVNFYLYDACTQVIEEINHTALAKDISVTCNISGKLSVFSDLNLIKILIRNLSSNAIKFTSRGGTVTLSAEEGDNEIIVSVADTGIGLDKEAVSKIFNTPGRKTTYGTDNEKGSGLGLLICKEFIDRIGGTIWVESEENKGSIFSFTIPGKSDNK